MLGHQPVERGIDRSPDDPRLARQRPTLDDRVEELGLVRFDDRLVLRRVARFRLAALRPVRLRAGLADQLAHAARVAHRTARLQQGRERRHVTGERRRMQLPEVRQLDRGAEREPEIDAGGEPSEDLLEAVAIDLEEMPIRVRSLSGRSPGAREIADHTHDHRHDPNLPRRAPSRS